jgi:hypothetical protein
MRPLKPHAPYCLYRKLTKAGYFWYVRYGDATSRRYTAIRSTGIPVKGRGGGRHDAEEAARAMLRTIRSRTAGAALGNHGPGFPA